MNFFSPSQHQVVVLSIDGDLSFFVTPSLSDESFCRRSTFHVASMLLGESQG